MAAVLTVARGNWRPEWRWRRRGIPLCFVIVIVIVIGAAIVAC